MVYSDLRWVYGTWSFVGGKGEAEDTDPANGGDGGHLNRGRASAYSFAYGLDLLSWLSGSKFDQTLENRYAIGLKV
jgi:hypothetical protein